ncbi:hypothetical protein [Bradyrhizobium sp. CB3481]|uniref:hypothetical protein n=1 Tax=Bradyrhizobium sp. CB3481 TaxID=3039158 RepID=UPI0024B15B63|nr:hypothetical protein [Bradyrhizobium sp. CB3481]WFU14038.1 hypothetical protein QA643_22720 [Bradyrhizobium sp. CB3481]
MTQVPEDRTLPTLICTRSRSSRTATVGGFFAQQAATMRSNALNLVATFLLGPTLLALLFAWQAREPGDSEFVFGFWLGFGLPGLALAMFLFWLGRPDRARRGGDQVSGMVDEGEPN